MNSTGTCHVWSRKESGSDQREGAENYSPGRGAGSCCLNCRTVAAMSSEFKIAETTQTLRAPAAKTSVRFVRWIPPIANHGTVTFAAAQRTYSRVTALAEGFVSVGKTGPMAT